MSEFKGSAYKVRCIDCVHLVGKRCSRKKTSTSPKKRRVCSLYGFKGEYENRTSPEALRVPYVDKNTRRLLRHMSELGIVPVTEAPDPSQGFKTFPMPRSTATAGVLDVKEQPAAGETSEAEQAHGFDRPEIIIPPTTAQKT
jgi:hypothetical protein